MDSPESTRYESQADSPTGSVDDPDGATLLSQDSPPQALEPSVACFGLHASCYLFMVYVAVSMSYSPITEIFLHRAVRPSAVLAASLTRMAV